MALSVPDATWEAKVDEVTEGMESTARTSIRAALKTYRDAVAGATNTFGLEDPAAIAAVNEDLLDHARHLEALLRTA